MVTSMGNMYPVDSPIVAFGERNEVVGMISMLAK